MFTLGRTCVVNPYEKCNCGVDEQASTEHAGGIEHGLACPGHGSLSTTSCILFSVCLLTGLDCDLRTQSRKFKRDRPIQVIPSLPGDTFATRYYLRHTE